MRVLIVEDEPQTRTRLVRAVEALNVETEAVGTCEAARSRLDGKPDILLTDLDLPDGHGVELIERAYGLDVPSLVITVFGDERQVVRAIEAGASGYLLKDGTAQDVAWAVEQVMAGGAPISPSIAKHLLQRLRPPPAAEAAAPDALAVKLTAREVEVLGLIAKGFTYAEIAGVLDLSTHTVTTHIRKTYRKLAVNSRGEAVYEAIQLGLIEVD